MPSATPARVLRADAWVLGGGIAGLWTCARLRAQGYAAGLIEARELGRGQTIASQGIIHGGVKYTLGGAAAADSRAIAAMPDRWRAALEGRGELDLSAAPVVSLTTMLWTLPGVTSRLVGAAASRALRARPARTTPAEAHEALRAAPKGVSLYTLSEPVIDVAQTLSALRGMVGPAVLAADGPEDVRLDPSDSGSAVVVSSLAARLEAPCIILASGLGNEALLRQAGAQARVAMQRRPLQMVMAQGDLPELHGHCIGTGSTPLCTITTSRTREGRTLWWIGGDIAERGAGLSTADAIGLARREVARCLPWVDFSAVRWAAWMVNRAEASTPNARRPVGPALIQAALGLFACWPTKLAYAPEVGDLALAVLERHAGPPRAGACSALDDALRALAAPAPRIATYPWDTEALTWI